MKLPKFTYNQINYYLVPRNTRKKYVICNSSKYYQHKMWDYYQQKRGKKLLGKNYIIDNTYHEWIMTKM